MPLPAHKTKIVATIGPASEQPETLRALIEAGLGIARLNFSHGNADYHAALIGRIREAAAACDRRVAIMGDLPGPKMRIGELAEEPVELVRDEHITLTTEECVGTVERVSVSFAGLPAAVKRGDALFLNDGYIQLEVTDVDGNDVVCRVHTGGELRSRKGLNLPGIDLGISAFTDNDREWLGFAAEHGVDAVSQSFVVNAQDIEEVRSAAAALGYAPFVIAKIERAAALDNLDAILEVADGIMVARGDLGVEIPIETIAVAQRRITERALRAGKPVITATQMLESMVTSRRPTRAEATDVANAILGGTDCVMLSAESAMGQFPVESVAMLAGIATAIEPEQDDRAFAEIQGVYGDVRSDGHPPRPLDLIARCVYHTVHQAPPRAVVVPTRSGASARNVARFRLPRWVVALSPDPATAQTLQFNYGVYPVNVDSDRADWTGYVRDQLAVLHMDSGMVLLTQGPSAENPRGNHRLEIIELDPKSL
ncbi:pyruvate kinase [Thioalkalivibrio sp.]|uniref:pyruvate kinase n=1 Tax=Thioalkalivibrio sp. TaxID=2093813 RepID=UPI0012D67243|nr:pyruvate kinase [Thioalkalivibrio sp.]TVP82996.1 MAG: pyruvate kinase [Thioalkalivibrio sp.]